MFDEVHGGPCCVASVLVLHREKVRVAKDCDQMVLEGQVDGPLLVVHPSLLRVFSEDYLLPYGQRPCWDVCHVARVRQE